MADRCGDQGQAPTVILFLIHEFHIEALCHHRDYHLHYQLCKGLAKADTLAAKEGQPGKGAALLPTWCLRQGVCGVEAIR